MSLKYFEEAKRLEDLNEDRFDLGFESLLSEENDEGIVYTTSSGGRSMKVVSRGEQLDYEETFMLEDRIVGLESDERLRQRTIWDSEGFLYGHTAKIVRDSYEDVNEARLLEQGEYGEDLGVEITDRDDVKDLKTREEFNECWRWLAYPEPDTDISLRDVYTETADFYRD